MPVSDDTMVRVEVEMTATEWRDCLGEARRDNTTLSRWARAILVCEVRDMEQERRERAGERRPSTETAATSTSTNRRQLNEQETQRHDLPR